MQSLHYTIYKTTNLINGKIYIGKHVTADLNDGYLGSGKLLRRAIVKYGVENFSKEILHIFDNEADMNAREAELVTDEFVLQETNYNLCVGGQGGFSYINREILVGERRLTVNRNNIQQAQTSEAKAKASATFKERYSNNDEWLAQRSAALRNSEIFQDAMQKRGPTFKGKTHSDATKEKISTTAKIKSAGERNSQFGTCWITDGVVSKKIAKTAEMPDGWTLGRTL